MKGPDGSVNVIPRENAKQAMDAGGKAYGSRQALEQDPAVDKMLADNPEPKPYYGFTPSNVGKNILEGAKGVISGGAALARDLVTNPNWVSGKDSTYDKFVRQPEEQEVIKAGEHGGAGLGGKQTVGEGAQAAGHALASAIPVIGPWAASLGEQAGTGDVGGAAGQVIGAGGTAEAIKGLKVLDRVAAKGAKVVNAAGRAGAAMMPPTDVTDVPQRMVRGLGATSPDPIKTLGHYQQALPYLADIEREAPPNPKTGIVKEALGLGGGAHSGEEITKAIQAKEKALGQPVQDAVTTHYNAPAGGKPDVDDHIRGMLAGDIGSPDPLMKLTRPDLTKLSSIGNGKGPLTIGEIDAARQYASDRAIAYHNAVSRGADPSTIVKAMNDWQGVESYARNVEYNTLKGLTGLDVDNIQSDRSALIHVHQAAVRAWAQDLRSSPSTLARSLGIPFGVSRIVAGGMSINVPEVMSGAAMAGVFAGFKHMMSNRNTLVNAMKDLGRSGLTAPDYQGTPKTPATQPPAQGPQAPPVPQTGMTTTPPPTGWRAGQPFQTGGWTPVPQLPASGAGQPQLTTGSTILAPPSSYQPPPSAPTGPALPEGPKPILPAGAPQIVLPPSSTVPAAEPADLVRGVQANKGQLFRQPATGKINRAYEGGAPPAPTPHPESTPTPASGPPPEAEGLHPTIVVPSGQLGHINPTDLKPGDTFTDDKGEPRRVLEIKPNGWVRTADGDIRNYRGPIAHQGVNTPRSLLAQGGKLHPPKYRAAPSEWSEDMEYSGSGEQRPHEVKSDPIARMTTGEGLPRGSGSVGAMAPDGRSLVAINTSINHRDLFENIAKDAEYDDPGQFWEYGGVRFGLAHSGEAFIEIENRSGLPNALKVLRRLPVEDNISFELAGPEQMTSGVRGPHVIKGTAKQVEGVIKRAMAKQEPEYGMEEGENESSVQTVSGTTKPESKPESPVPVDTAAAPRSGFGGEPAGQSSKPNSRAKTAIWVPGWEEPIAAHYELRNLGDLQTSHSGVTFARNPQYLPENEKGYMNAAMQRWIVEGSRGGVFDHQPPINQAPIVTSDGQVLGDHNEDVMRLQRVYRFNKAGAEAYREAVLKQAKKLGLSTTDNLDKPVLVRAVHDNAFIDPEVGPHYMQHATDILNDMSSHRALVIPGFEHDPAMPIEGDRKSGVIKGAATPAVAQRALKILKAHPMDFPNPELHEVESGATSPGQKYYHIKFGLK